MPPAAVQSLLSRMRGGLGGGVASLPMMRPLGSGGVGLAGLGLGVGGAAAFGAAGVRRTVASAAPPAASASGADGSGGDADADGAAMFLPGTAARRPGAAAGAAHRIGTVRPIPAPSLNVPGPGSG